MLSAPDPSHALAARLRRLRYETWPGRTVKQPDLGRALGVSTPLISSWESEKDPRLPPPERLANIALFYATPRTAEGRNPHLIGVDDLSEDERAHYDALRAELLALRSAALGGNSAGHQADATSAPASTSPWHFADGAPVTIVCPPLPPKLRKDRSHSDPNSPDYIALYGYADLDALTELYGQVWAANPDGQASFVLAPSVTADHLTTHLVLLGGAAWNPLTREVLDRLDVPVSQQPHPGERAHDTVFEVVAGAERLTFSSRIRLDHGQRVLIEDVAHFCRGRNPFNRRRTVTVCSGNFGRGVYGAVRSLTDRRFRDRNAAYVRWKFAPDQTFSILSRVQIVDGSVITPDWTQPRTVLHEWVGEAA
jgi:hypothetical protein